MNEAYAAGARVLWVGLPPMSSPNVSSAFARQLNAVFRAEAEAHPAVTYFPSWHLLSGPGGQFTQYIKHNGDEIQSAIPTACISPRRAGTSSGRRSCGRWSRPGK